MKLTEIIGLEEKHARLLEKAGIKEVEDLKTLDTWQEHADLMRIQGVTPELANAINLIGIDSVKEFAYRNAKTTLEKLKELKKENPKILAKVPTLKDVEAWINDAKSLEQVPKKDDKFKKTHA